MRAAVLFQPVENRVGHLWLRGGVMSKSGTRRAGLLRRACQHACAIAAVLFLAQTQASGKGIVTSFDVPGALATLPVGINASNVIAGFYESSDHVAHGFVRNASGTIETFDAHKQSS